MALRDWLRGLAGKASAKRENPQGRPRNRGPGSQPPMRRTGLGLLLIAIFRKEGLEDFGNTPDAYLASLAPLIAYALVSCVLSAADGHIENAAQVFLMMVCSWLAPAVISHPIARVWGRGDAWPRYANIVNWSQMLMFLVLSAALAIAKLAVTAGLPQNPVLLFCGIAVVVYAICFHWFVARGTLALSRWRTVALLLSVVIGNYLVVAVPLLSTGAKLPGFVLP